METISQGVLRPDALSFDSSGDLYVANSFTKADGFGRTVTVYAPGSTKLLRTITKGVCYPIALAFDSSGNLYVADEFQLAPKCKGTRDPLPVR
jgi:DNA-binding beta-propeller fold protein YncE